MDKLEYERRLLNEGYKYICGVDEVGRGPLAGPVVCAAVIMPLDKLVEGVDDSKKIGKDARNNRRKNFGLRGCLPHMPRRTGNNRRNKHFAGYSAVYEKRSRGA